MSRRIILCLLVASTALIRTQAFADRECFDNPCRLPDVVEPSAPAVPSPSIEEAETPAAGAGRTDTQSRSPSRMAADQPSSQDAPGLSPDSEYPRARRYLAPRTPRQTGEARASARVTNRPPGDLRAEVLPTIAPTSVIGQGSVYSGTAIVDTTGAINAVVGHRPNGMNFDHRGASVYLLAPNAKIISIDAND